MGLPKIPLAVLLWGSLLCPCIAAPQARQTFKLAAINETGSKRYTPDQIIAASGLQIGQTVSEDDFKQAVERLGETGAFGDIAYRYKYSDEGATLEFDLTDSQHLVPARFENFVWFSDQQLASRFHERVPLFVDNELPLSGSLPDLVSDTLQAMLIEHHVEGRADYLRAADLDGPVTAIVYSVTGPHILVRNVKFAGAVPDELPALQEAANKLQGVEYNRSAARLDAEKDFLPVFLRRGYLKAAFSGPQAKVVEETPDQTMVDVTIPVVPGHQYNFASANWSGNTVFPAEKLQPLLRLQPGKPANAIELAADVKAAQDLYGTRGYMAATIKPIPKFDEEHLTVAYQIQVTEGDVYKMGELEIRGVDKRASDRLDLAWKMREGDVYDSSYCKRFLDESARSILNLDQWNTTVHETVDDKGKTVDVTLHFDPRPLK